MRHTLVVLAMLSISTPALADESGAAHENPLDLSATTGLVYRSIVVPGGFDVCVPLGKYCPIVGQADSGSARLDGYGGFVQLGMLKAGPLRIGGEFGFGGTGEGIAATYRSDSVHIDSFFFMTAAANIGFATHFGPALLRIDGLAGITNVTSTTSLRTIDGLPLDLTSTVPLLEARGTILCFVSPHVAVGAFGGAGSIGMSPHVGPPESIGASIMPGASMPASPPPPVSAIGNQQPGHYNVTATVSSPKLTLALWCPNQQTLNWTYDVSGNDLIFYLPGPNGSTRASTYTKM